MRVARPLVSLLAGTTGGVNATGRAGPYPGVMVPVPDGLLRRVQSPADLKALAPEQLPQLADEIRAFLIENVSRTGGHLGPNLGVVELTIALHRAFDSPTDPVVFDTGHQSYVHKILTGRQDAFPTLRQKGGLAGYPSRAESEHDWVENSPRLDRAVVRRRAGQGDPAPAPARARSSPSSATAR